MQLPSDNNIRIKLLRQSNVVQVFLFLYMSAEKNDSITTSRSIISRNTGLTDKQVRLALFKLTMFGMISIISSNRGSLITFSSQSDTTKTPSPKPIKTSSNKQLLETFEKFRQRYPGRRRSCMTEFNAMRKHHHDFTDIIPQLPGIIENQITWRRERIAAGVFVPEWQHLKTWIHQRSWELEKQPIETHVHQETSTNPAHQPIKRYKRE